MRRSLALVAAVAAALGGSCAPALEARTPELASTPKPASSRERMPALRSRTVKRAAALPGGEAAALRGYLLSRRPRLPRAELWRGESRGWV